MRLENLFVVANTTFQSNNEDQDMNYKEKEFIQSNKKVKNIGKMNFNQIQKVNNIPYENSEKNIQNNTGKIKIPQKSKSVKQFLSQFLNIDETFNKSQYSPFAIEQSKSHHKRSKSVDRVTLLSNKDIINGSKDVPVLKTFRPLGTEDEVEMRRSKARTPQMSLLLNGNLSLRPNNNQSHLSLIPTNPQSSYLYQPEINKAEKTIKNNGQAEKSYDHNISSYETRHIENEMRVKNKDVIIEAEKTTKIKENELQISALSNANQKDGNISKENFFREIENDPKENKVLKNQIDKPTFTHIQNFDSIINKKNKIENIASIKTANFTNSQTLKERNDNIENTNESNKGLIIDIDNQKRVDYSKSDKNEHKTRVYINSVGNIQPKKTSENIYQTSSDFSKYITGLQKEDKDIAFKNAQFNMRKIKSELSFASNKQDRYDDSKKKPGTLMIRPASNVSTSLKLSAHLFKLNSYQDITQGSFAPPVQSLQEDDEEEENLQQPQERIKDKRSDGKKVKSVLFAEQPIVHTFEQSAYSDNEYDYESKEGVKDEEEEEEDYYTPPKKSQNLFNSTYAGNSASLGSYKSKSLSDISFDLWQNFHQQDSLEESNETQKNDNDIYNVPVEEAEEEFSLATDLIF